MINLIKDIDLFENICKYDYILLGTNVYCTFSKGLEYQISLDYPYISDFNMSTRYGDASKLGTVLECTSEGEPTIYLLYIYRGYEKNKKDGGDFLNYSALEKCIKICNGILKGKKVACPLLGCSRFDGNGDSKRVIDILEKQVTNFDLDVYDYFIKSRSERMKEVREKELAIKKVNRKEYYRIVNERKIKAEERFKKNGRARY